MATNEQQHSGARPSLSTVIGLLVPYGLFLAAIYLTAYWTPLGLRPFQYANAADLGSATIAGLVIAFIGLVIGVCQGYLLAYLLAKVIPTPSEKLGKIVAATILIGAALAIPLLWLLWSNPIKWFLIGLFASFLALPLLLAIPIFRKLIEDDHARPLVVIMIAYMPACMYGYGATAIADVVSTERGMLVEYTSVDTHIGAKERLKYAGMLGEYHVAYDLQAKRTLLLPKDGVIAISPNSTK